MNFVKLEREGKSKSERHTLTHLTTVTWLPSHAFLRGNSTNNLSPHRQISGSIWRNMINLEPSFPSKSESTNCKKNKELSEPSYIALAAGSCRSYPEPATKPLCRIRLSLSRPVTQRNDGLSSVDYLDYLQASLQNLCSSQRLSTYSSPAYPR